MNNDTSIFEKINAARTAFHAKTQTKTGKNQYANYTYFELSDFLPDALQAFSEAGLCGLISFSAEEATMRIVDVKTRTVETITSPMAVAQLKGCHPIQNLGAVETYLRRYLWATAMELVEADKVDAGEKASQETLPKDKFIAKKFPASQENDRGSRPPSTEPGARVSDPAASESHYWQGRITDVAKHQGESAKGPWTLFRINMEDGNTATTFDEALAKDAEIMIGQEVRVIYEPNKRKAGTFTYKGFEPIEDPIGALEKASAQLRDAAKALTEGEDLPWN